MPENKILIIRGGAIGDFVLTLPVLAALRRQFPDTRLEILGYPHIAQLALAGGLADAIRPIEARPLAGFFARGGTLAPELADYFARFAIIISYLYDPDGIFQENVTRVARTQFIVGPHRPDEAAALHATEVFLKPLERLAIFDADVVPRLNVGQASCLSRAPQRANPAPGVTAEDSRALPVQDRQDAFPTIALHPGSGGERKNWAEANWLELLHQLVARTNWRLLLIGGEADGERPQRLAAALPKSRVTLALHLPLTELAARLSSCMAFLGHDSGITHLAAAVGLPTFALWGNTIEAVWRPSGSNVFVLRHAGGLDTLSPALVFDEVTTKLSRQQQQIVPGKHVDNSFTMD